MFDIRDEVRKYSGDIKSVRKELHRHPELGNKEWRTAERIERFLNDHGISTERKLGTAVIGRLRGAEGGMTIALRADMDALPVTETTEDFGYYQRKVPGTFIHIGAGCGLPLHNPGFLPGESVACELAGMHVSMAIRFLNDNQSKVYHTLFV